ncbi:class I SAM-dependent methyltransferase [Streptomyces sp. NPDC020192]|uniref:class I SAM-dependent methyltransferase n=1 Tax=Streptomyces sp. NPDC020192 TaxID=3365066 RepID=UPI0037B85DEF
MARAIVNRLPELAPRSRLIDLACGPGEPGLSVLERHPDVELRGVDASQDILAHARTRASGRANVRFAHTDMKKLDVPSGSVDAVVSRFGFLALEDVARITAEFSRIARPGCAFSISVWDRLELNTVAYASMESLRGLADEALLPPLDELDARAAGALPEHTLAEIGVTELHTELFSWSTPANGFDLLWSMLTGPGIWHPAVSTLAADAVTELRRCYAARLEDYAAPNGTYMIPSTRRLLWGHI